MSPASHLSQRMVRYETLDHSKASVLEVTLFAVRHCVLQETPHMACRWKPLLRFQRS